ncbi:MAG TPA: hypothetical protein VFU93_00760 [Acidimicrobiales bacterium]|nr:hypothetical protein [Acidimicrobiales bacterium]
MLLWFAGASFLAVWLVFRDPAIDHRLVMAGAILPDFVDGATGGPWVLHSVVGSIALLTIVMLGTVGRRLLRRRLIALPIGTFLHLVFDGAWTDTDSFWWPFTGGFGDGRLPSLERGVFAVVLEVVGLAILVWAYRRFGLDDATRRSYFLRTGRLSRELV